MTIQSEAEEKYPGITKYGCLDPYYNFELMNPKCVSCPRHSKCRRDSAFEIIRADEELDEAHHPNALRAREELEFRRKKKSAKPKPKRKKVCRCKK